MISMTWETLIKKHPLAKIVVGTLYNLPTPISISNLWNFGRLLGLFLAIQLFTGLFLASQYSRELISAFDSVDHIVREVEWGWTFRVIHLNGARFFFASIYIHMGRGLYYNSSSQRETWNIGVIIFILRIATAFLGYVLPFGQMRFWGATVITNLVSAIPVVGGKVVLWLWGGYSVGGPTLTRFFILHFVLPFIISALVILHIFFLHFYGRRNPLGRISNTNIVHFSPFFLIKDFVFFFIVLFVFFFIVLFYPYLLGDPENFILANPLVTPIHIVPEWYFLFAYAILRAIPNKILGVVFLALSVIILLIPSTYISYVVGMNNLNRFSISKQVVFFIFIGVFSLLTWLGAKPVEAPFLLLSCIFLSLYFSLFVFFSLIN